MSTSILSRLTQTAQEEFTVIVHKTTDYKMFREMAGNRDLNKGHLSRLIKSIAQVNYLDYQPILVSDEGYVIDGQHRLAACKKLKLPVPYIVMENAAHLTAVRQLNANLKSWSYSDYVESYARMGNRDYQILLDFSEKYELPLVTATYLLSGRVIYSGGGDKPRKESVKDGTFKVHELKEAEEFMRRLKDTSPYVDSIFWRSREFMRALQYIYNKGAKHDILMKHLAREPRKILRQPSYKEYILVLGSIYNSDLGKRSRIELFA